MKKVSLKHKKQVTKSIDFTIKNDKNKDFSLRALRGKYVLLDFWAYWCKPCIETFPHLKEIKKNIKMKTLKY